MKKWMTILCAILIFSTAVITVKAEDAGETDGAGDPVVLAETSVSAGDFTISGDNLSVNDYRYENNVLTILNSTPITISTPNNDADIPTSDRIVVDSSNGANITLSNVNIKTDSGAAFDITKDSGSVTIILAGDNTLESGKIYASFHYYGYAGLQNNGVSVTITGSGNLTATGGSDNNAGSGAGIGGSGYYNIERNGKNITISGSGTVTAIGGVGAAGIGGGGNGSGDTITINGSGTVIAIGGKSGGAGIGGGNNGSGTNINLNQ